MFDIGFAELFLLSVIALVVLGPERLPEAARAVGRWAGKARAFARSITNELDKEVRYSETTAQLRAAQASVKKQMDDFEAEAKKDVTAGEQKPAESDAKDKADDGPTPDEIEDQRIAELNAKADAEAFAAEAEKAKTKAEQQSDSSTQEPADGTPAPQARPAAAPEKRG